MAGWPCFPMVMIIDNSRMNLLGRLEYGAGMRHRNPLLCTMAYTALPVLPVEHRRRDLPFSLPPASAVVTAFTSSRASTRRDRWAYDTQLDWINKMFTGVNVTSLKKTR